MPATVLVAALTVLAPGCGGTLEGKYRRGELTSTTTTGRAPATTPTTAVNVPGQPATPGSTTTTTTVPTSGNAAGPVGRGEPNGVESGGTIVESAAWRAVVSPPGGRHR